MEGANLNFLRTFSGSVCKGLNVYRIRVVFFCISVTLWILGTLLVSWVQKHSTKL